MREKLMDIVCESIATDRCVAYCSHPHCGLVHAVVQKLIANGVTTQQWIPVTERLPSDDIPSKMYLCYWNGYIRVCKYWRTQKCFELRGKEVKVTHWMPLPEPPAIDK